ncbi:MAG: DNA adenine methylase, partial [Candidatus Micrarchaeaceae archaeon]
MDGVAPLLFPAGELPVDPRRKGPREYHTPNGDIPSLLKWTGSKRSQAQRIADVAPPHDRYFEPFLGGGALLFHFARIGAKASDVYAPLIDFWKLVRDDPQHLAEDYAS